VVHQADLIRQVIVVGRDGSALECVADLRRVKAEDLGAPEPANVARAMRAPECMCRVEYQLQVVAIGDAGESLDVARATPQVDAQDPAGLRTDEPLHPLGI